MLRKEVTGISPVEETQAENDEFEEDLTFTKNRVTMVDLTTVNRRETG